MGRMRYPVMGTGQPMPASIPNAAGAAGISRPTDPVTNLLRLGP
ncbi:MAG TPA: hypothetical protein PLV05_08110 [Verrucomicrobiota bacterium]|nr:hypothetical protein [Verrucomicrobiota bacterium]HRR64218.1 hypothetical protein [Candidatus Paceibacterota bacterium]HOQ54833.1 hypothetical protein [Verrucomicrobiota bacterium]HPC53050.1 hypothetical protein [Verrucomicrobiota bacterium]HPL35074.1 hypothetical protein [Verrucomicrobiota bacterium]